MRAACDGIERLLRGYVMRGGREMEDHFQCLWDLFHSIPSLRPGPSFRTGRVLLAEQACPNYSPAAQRNRGEDAHTDGKFNLSQKGCMDHEAVLHSG